MAWKLRVREYGKIKYAEIEAAPLTLFVGDNNSGKSYLLSLLWGIQNLGVNDLMENQSEQKAPAEDFMMDWIGKQIDYAWEKGVWDVCINEIANELQAALQEGLNRNKNRFLKKIFNSPEVKIKELEIELPSLEKTYVQFIWKKMQDNSIISWGRLSGNDLPGNEIKEDKKVFYRICVSDTEKIELTDNHNYYLKRVILHVMIHLITGIPLNDAGWNQKVYLPAARTGFMLTKDVINKVGRNATFNLATEKNEISPFVRPINQFLDVMNDLAVDGERNGAFEGVVEYLENGMAEGRIRMSTLPNKEVMYVPVGRKHGLPLRVVSAVVTEISPLILMLKHKKNLQMLFYEEPEMCLHPQLQQKMGRVICQLVNAGLEMMVTTHSDILLQYINNMISLSVRDEAEKIKAQLGYTSCDLLRPEQVKVYQFKVNSRGKTEVEELLCGKNGFSIPTFNDALDKIMDEAYLIQE